MLASVGLYGMLSYLTLCTQSHTDADLSGTLRRKQVLGLRHTEQHARHQR
jgi:hypothetical protein